MSNIMQTTVGYYDLSETLQSITDAGIKVHTFQPGEVIRARNKETKELLELESERFLPHKHTIFIGDREFNVINRMSKYLGSDDASKTPEGSVEEHGTEGNKEHPSRKAKVSKGLRKDKCD